MADQAREQRIMDLCGFIVGQLNARARRRKITILIDGDRFGVSSIEELMNPADQIPSPWRAVQAPTGA